MEQFVITQSPSSPPALPFDFAPAIEPRSLATPLRGSEQPIQVLIVDDDPAMCKLLTVTLKQENYTVFAVDNGEDALAYFTRHAVDLVLLDVNMPQMDGHLLCSEMRRHSYVPIVFVTACARMDDLVHAFQLGADHYITKPFTIQELRARIRAVLGRVHKSGQQRVNGTICIGDIVLNEENLEVLVRGRPASLTPNEFRLLHYLMKHPDQLIPKDVFQSEVWRYQASGDINFMRVTMRRLRMKIEQDPSNPRYLKTAHGVGYQFCSQPVGVES